MAYDGPEHPGFDALDERPSTTLNRREFLTFIGATLAATACGEMPDQEGTANFPSVVSDPTAGQVRPPQAPRLTRNPFQLGVASGDPTDESIILWTRLAPRPLDGGGMPDQRVPLVWEIARDDGGSFDESIVGRDWLHTHPQLAHSAHVDVRGLQPDTWYRYRFRVGDQYTSPVGRTRTFPAPDQSPDRLRMATASCQNYVDGYYTAHKHLAREEIDLVAFLGDYIYEYGYGGGVRSHMGPTLETIGQFRQRYALYKSDENLQASHARCPWLMTWDDHEVSNNYAGWEPNKSNIDDMKALRAAAYQAYYEHMPLRVSLGENRSRMQIYRSLQYGDLVNLCVLDGRQYRSGIVCDGEVADPCDEALSAETSMLGEEQKRWLIRQIKESSTRWNAVCQQTVFSPVNFGNAIINPDQWDGYQAERQELLDFFGSAAARNVTVLTGDIHTAGFSRLGADDDKPDKSETVGFEIVATSITSGNAQLGGAGDVQEVIQEGLEHVEYFNPGKRGYCILEYTPESCTVQFRQVSTVEKRVADRLTDTGFEVQADSLDHRRLPPEELG